MTLHPDTIPLTHPALAVFRDTVHHEPGERTIPDLLSARSCRRRFRQSHSALQQRGSGARRTARRVGKVIIAASSARNDLEPSCRSSRVYVPYVFQLLSYLGQGETAHRKLRLDEPMFLSLPLSDFPTNLVRITPLPTARRHRKTVRSARGVTFTSYAAASRAGVYRVSVDNSKTTDAFAVGGPSDEGNLAYAGPSDRLRRRRQGYPPVALPSPRLRHRWKKTERQPLPLRHRKSGDRSSGPFLPLLFLESLLAQLWGRRG